ncbi:MAG: hypothetical protein CMJ29_11585 [Phycisphaerae bacterium]|nr:hypothetical protein [Phycisphaerae bacterium]
MMLNRLYQFSRDQSLKVIPFPVEAARILQGQHQNITSTGRGAAIGIRDRRMDVLARELGCLVHFEPDSDEPEAA